ERGPGRGISLVVTRRVGDDVEAPEGAEIDTQRPDRGEDPVVGRILQHEHVALLVDLEQLRVGRVWYVGSICPGGDASTRSCTRGSVPIARGANDGRRPARR